MIINDIKIFLQNVWKNNLIVNTILKINFNFDIIYIQELSRSIICSIPSFRNCEGEFLVGIVNYPNWLTFARTSETENKFSRVIIYNIRLASLCFSLCKDIINHRDILLILFFNNNDIFWLMNIYSNSFHMALKYLKNTKVYIHNFLIMTSDFNI